MRTIYIVHYDWATNGGSDEGILGVYEHLDDAIGKMDEYWQEERELGYLDEYDEFECDERKREAWINGYYCELHTRVEVREQYLYSREDVANGLA
jgi:hypothetical protein